MGVVKGHLRDASFDTFGLATKNQRGRQKKQLHGPADLQRATFTEMPQNVGLVSLQWWVGGGQVKYQMLRMTA